MQRSLSQKTLPLVKTDEEKYRELIDAKLLMREHIKRQLEKKYEESVDEQADAGIRKLLRREAYKLNRRAIQLGDEARTLFEDWATKRPLTPRVDLVSNSPSLTPREIGLNKISVLVAIDRRESVENMVFRVRLVHSAGFLCTSVTSDQDRIFIAASKVLRTASPWSFAGFEGAREESGH